VAVEVLTGPVVAHCGSGVGVAGCDLHVTKIHSSVEHGGDVCLSICGWARRIRTPAVSAIRRSRGVAACRSIRAPSVEQDRAGCAVPGGPVDGPAGRAGGRGTSTTLPPLPQTRRTRWPCSSPRSSMLAPVASKILARWRRGVRPRQAITASGSAYETATELVAGVFGAEYDDRRTSRIQWRKVTSWTCSSSPASQ